MLLGCWQAAAWSVCEPCTIHLVDSRTPVEKKPHQRMLATYCRG